MDLSLPKTQIKVWETLNEKIQASSDLDQGLLKADLRAKTALLLGTLTHDEGKVLTERYGLVDGQQKTLEKTGEICNFSKERARQIEAKALRKMRHPSRSKYIKDYRDM